MILEKIKDHFENKNCVKITRIVGKKTTVTSNGYIVNYSSDFILFQEAGDFRLSQYNISPLSQIQKVRFSKNDQYYNQIMIWEGEAEKVGISYKIDLSNWQAIFKSLKSYGLNIIVECEDPEIESFTIGPIIKATKKLVYIQNFDISGFFDEKPTSIDFESITKVQFDDRYINVFSKYLRHRKSKK